MAENPLQISVKKGRIFSFWNPIDSTIHVARSGIEGVGEIFILFYEIVKRFPYFFKNPMLTVQQMINIGVSSIPLIFVTSMFTGMVAAVQSEYQFRDLVPDKFIGTACSKMIIIELAPVLTALVMAGRVGSALAAEIASMKEKEEIDAMRILDLDPLRYLAMPRLITFMLMVPVLTVFSMFLAIIGGWIVSVLSLGLTNYTYLNGLTYLFEPWDVFAGLIKSFFFGIIVCLLGYNHGQNADHGAKGVGLATMKVVVSSCVGILIFDFLIAILLF
jgi:phospholipid/cholesterol/gamma-HCH transport system permease protein